MKLYIIDKNNNILEEYSEKSIRDLYKEVSEKHQDLKNMLHCYIFDTMKRVLDKNTFNGIINNEKLYNIVYRMIKDKIVKDENLENLLDVYFNKIGLKCVISISSFIPNKIVVFYDVK